MLVLPGELVRNLTYRHAGRIHHRDIDMLSSDVYVQLIATRVARDDQQEAFARVTEQRIIAYRQATGDQDSPDSEAAREICEFHLKATLAPSRYSEKYVYWIDQPPQIEGKPPTQRGQTEEDQCNENCGDRAAIEWPNETPDQRPRA